MRNIAITAIFCLLSISFIANADMRKRISSEDGLSNNAILSLYQDNIGHIYIGTADGLNIWDGHSIKIFNAADGYNYFYGNMIKHIYGSVDGNMFLQTNYGLAGVYPISKHINFYSDLGFFRRIAVIDKEHLYALDENNRLHYFITSSKEISAISNFSLPANDTCHQMLVANDGRLCLFTSSNIYLLSFEQNKDSIPSIQNIQDIKLRCRFVAADNEEDKHYIITQDNELYIFNSNTCETEYLSSFTNKLDNDDRISGIIPTDEGYYISFWQKGLFFLKKGNHTLEATDIDYGVFTMIKDRKQPIIWVGTDCNGLICYSLDSDSIHSITFGELPYPIKMPVRAIHLDKKNNLWFGTKGDGLYRIRNFKLGGTNLSRSNVDIFTVDNSELSYDSIYTIAEGGDGILWIGTDGDGVNWWSEKKGRIGKVKGSEKIKKIHSIIEQNDSTLWISTDGCGTYKCKFHIINDIPVFKSIDTLQLSHPFDFSMPIYTMAMQNDSIIWFGSRGKGVLSYNTNNEKSRIIQFPTDRGFATNEIFYISKSGQMLFATGNGLVAYSPDTDSLSIPEFVAPKATHAIMSDSEGNIWVSTNSGIISLDKNLNYRSSYDRVSGLDILEYSDGACYNDSENNLLFFGGINGITIIEKNKKTESESQSYIPEINISNFIQNNEYHHISQMMSKGKLRIPYSKSIFGIQFSVVDNLHYSDYKFSYCVDNQNWVDINSNIIYMPTLDPGHYKLRIKYLNKATLYESEECILPIYIIPPFYKSSWAIALYTILTCAAIYLSILYYKRRNAAMKEKIHKKYSNEILKIKSDTVGIITEELSVQITFILALCQQIRQQSNSSFVSDKVNLVEYNVAKINKMLNILNEYKGVSDSVINPGEVSLIHVSHLSHEVLNLIKSSIADKEISIVHDIEEDITIALNKEAYHMVFYSLINKAVSMVSGNKEIRLKISREQGGIAIESNISANKQRFRELKSSFNDNNKEEFELFVCKMIVSAVNGKMICEYNDDSNTIHIKIYLPSQSSEVNSLSHIDTYLSESINTLNTIIENDLPKKQKAKSPLNQIYLVSRNKDISSFLEYFLSEKYNVTILDDNEKALAQIYKLIPSAIIYDISSVTNSFHTFIENVKQHKKIEQMSIVALTSSMQITEREECIKIGADLCISFPFNMDYLHSALEKLLLKKKSTAEYYKSPLSTYIIDNGKIIHYDDKMFFDNIINFIQDNIADPNLIAPDIAKHLNTSTRVMYRRLESVTDKKLHQIIKEIRMQQAAQLLSSSKHSIDEIMYKVGYDNRSTFYRNFKDTYKLTPKEYRDNIRKNVINSLTLEQTL